MRRSIPALIALFLVASLVPTVAAGPSLEDSTTTTSCDVLADPPNVHIHGIGGPGEKKVHVHEIGGNVQTDCIEKA